MALIPLCDRRGNARAFAIVDDADFERLGWRKWHLGDRGYARRNASRAELRAGSSRTVRMHREILGLSASDPLEVDHVNGEKLDNRRKNLRTVSRAEQLQNLRLSKGSSPHLGVCWSSQKRRWSARSADGHGGRVHLGWFSKESEAADAVASYRAAQLPYSAEAMAWA